MIEASSAATPQTMIVAFVSFEPVPPLDLSLDMSRAAVTRDRKTGAEVPRYGDAVAVEEAFYGQEDSSCDNITVLLLANRCLLVSGP